MPGSFVSTWLLHNINLYNQTDQEQTNTSHIRGFLIFVFLTFISQSVCQFSLRISVWKGMAYTAC